MSSVGLHVDCANAILNAFRHVSHDIVAVYVRLHTGVPGVDGEDFVSVGDDSLKIVSFGAAAEGALPLATFPIWTNVDTSETLTHVSAWDGAVGPGTDNPLFAVALTTPQAWNDGDTYTLDELGFSLASLMAD